MRAEDFGSWYDFGSWIRYKLSEKDRTIAWLCRETGYGNCLVLRYEQGQSPRIDIFLGVCVILAELYEVSLNEMLCEALFSISSYRLGLMRLKRRAERRQ